MQDATRLFPLTRMCPGIGTNVCMHVFVSLCVHVRIHSHACSRTHRPFRGWITEELLSPSRVPPAGGTRALSLARCLSHSLSLYHSHSLSLILLLARFRACSLSIAVSLSLSSVSVCHTRTCLNTLEYGEQYITQSTRCCEQSHVNTFLSHVCVRAT